MRLATARRAWAQWQAAAGPWRGWSVCPALLAPEVEDISPRPARGRPVETVVDGVKRLLEAGGTALILDLEPILAVCVAARLNELGLANAVLLLPRWPYRQAILHVDGLLHSLVSRAPKLIPGDLPNVAFVLDAERTQGVPHRARKDPRADNRYRLTVADLPNLAALRARGIRKVVKLSRISAYLSPSDKPGGFQHTA